MLDFRSDFLTSPKPAVVEAMTEAAARRGGFG